MRGRAWPSLAGGGGEPGPDQLVTSPTTLAASIWRMRVGSSSPTVPDSTPRTSPARHGRGGGRVSRGEHPSPFPQGGRRARTTRATASGGSSPRVQLRRRTACPQMWDAGAPKRRSRPAVWARPVASEVEARGPKLGAGRRSRMPRRSPETAPRSFENDAGGASGGWPRLARGG